MFSLKKVLVPISLTFGLFACQTHEGHEHHGHEHHSHHKSNNSKAGRLVITAKESPSVYVYDLNSKPAKFLNSFELSQVPSIIYSSPSYRFAIAGSYEDNKVQFIDGGQYWHDDHGHSDSPSLLKFALDGSKPAHINLTDKQTAVHFDGENLTQARIVVLNDENIENASGFAQTKLPQAMHGAAEARGKYLVTSSHIDIISEGPARNRANQVSAYEQHNDHYHKITTFEDKCPQLHGSAQNKNFIIFGCVDGVLAVKQEDKNFSGFKIPYSNRIAVLRGNKNAKHLVGYLGSHVAAINPETREINEIIWNKNNAEKIYGAYFNKQGNKFLLLDENGKLTIFNYSVNSKNPFTIDKEINLVKENQEGLKLALSPINNLAFVSFPEDKKILTIDINKGEIINSQDLSFAPSGLAWVGEVK